jgi:hypothetical protein
MYNIPCYSLFTFWVWRYTIYPSGNPPGASRQGQSKPMKASNLAGKAPPYDKQAQAYDHLLKDTENKPWEPHEEGDWVLVLFTETMNARLFNTLEEVGHRYSWDTYRHNVYVVPEQLSAKFTTKQLLIFMGKLGLVTDETHLPIELARQLWAYLQRTADRVTGTVANGEVKDEDLYHVNVALLKSEKIQALIKTSLPPQAIVVAKALADEEKSTYTEEELSSFANKILLDGRLKTKQSPLRIVKYYAPNLAQLGVMRYSTWKEGKRPEQAADIRE